MADKKQLVVSFNMQQVRDIEKLSGMDIGNSAELKQAIESLIAIAPSNKAGNPNFVKKSQKEGME